MCVGRVGPGVQFFKISHYLHGTLFPQYCVLKAPSTLIIHGIYQAETIRRVNLHPGKGKKLPFWAKSVVAQKGKRHLEGPQVITYRKYL
jgi:hypothetical protein